MKKFLAFLLLLCFSFGFADYSNFDEIRLDKATGRYGWTADPDTYLQRSAANTIILVVGGSTVGTLTSTGLAAAINGAVGATTPANAAFLDAGIATADIEVLELPAVAVAIGSVLPTANYRATMNINGTNYHLLLRSQ